MATIPRNEVSLASPAVEQLQRQRPATGLARGLASVAQASDAWNAQIEKRDNMRDVAWVTKQNADDRLWANERLKELTAAAPPDGSGIAAQLAAEMQQRGVDNQKAAPSDQARFLIDRQNQDLRATVGVQAQIYEATARGHYTTQQLGEAAATNAAYLALHPEDLDKIKAETAASTRALAANTGMNADALNEHQKNTFALYAQSAVGGRILTGYENNSIPALQGVLGDIKSGKYPDLQADDVLRLRAEADSRIKALEAEQRAKAEKQDTLAGEAYRDAREVVTGGGLPDMSALLTITRGTKYEPEANNLVTLQAQLAQFTRAPTLVQAAALQAEEARITSGGTSTGNDIVRRNLMRESFAKAQGQMKDGGGIGYYAQLHGLDLGVDPLGDSANRAAIAKQATAWAGGVPQLPLTDGEVATLHADLTTQDATQGAKELTAFALAYPDSKPQLATALGAKDPAFGVAFAVAGDPSTVSVVSSILRGRKVLLGSAKDFKPNRQEVRAAVPQDVIDAYAHHDVELSAMLDAATAIYVDKRGINDATLDSGTFEKSIYDITGGAPINFNGAAILPPTRGMTEQNLWSDMKNLTAADLLTYGHVKNPGGNEILQATRPPFGDIGYWIPGEPSAPHVVTTDEIMRYGSLIDAGNGLYQIKMGPGVLVTDGGEPYLLDLHAYHQDALARPVHERSNLTKPLGDSLGGGSGH